MSDAPGADAGRVPGPAKGQGRGAEANEDMDESRPVLGAALALGAVTLLTAPA